LRRLDLWQYLQFVETVRDLIEYDRAIDLFEYALQKILFRHLRPYFERMPGPRAGHLPVASLGEECSVLLSALAHVGQEDAAALPAFQRGAGFLDATQGAVRLLEGEARSLANVDAALDRLTQASAAAKRNILLACAQTVAADGQVQVREAELLRAIADALDCPIPPFVEAISSSTSSSRPDAAYPRPRR